jgi:hypothetical protein
MALWITGYLRPLQQFRLWLKEAGIKEAVIASTGNAAVLCGCLCTGRDKIMGFMTSLVPSENYVALFERRY